MPEAGSLQLLVDFFAVECARQCWQSAECFGCILKSSRLMKALQFPDEALEPAHSVPVDKGMLPQRRLAVCRCMLDRSEKGLVLW